MKKKWLIFIATIGIIFIAYRLIAIGTFARSLNNSLALPLDSWIPFIPATIFFYVTIYFFWLPPIISKNVNVQQYARIIAAVALAFVITFALHIIIPSSYPRPILSADAVNTSWTQYFVQKIYNSDLPNNTFPSSHVVAAVTLMIMAYPYLRKKAFTAYASWGALISLSTLTVKQHYIVDVAVAIAVAIFSAWIIKRYWPDRTEVTETKTSPASS